MATVVNGATRSQNAVGSIRRLAARRTQNIALVSSPSMYTDTDGTTEVVNTGDPVAVVRTEVQT